MRPIQGASAVLAVSLAAGGCALAPAGPPAEGAPQLLRLATYQRGEMAGPLAPAPGQGWGKGGLSDAAVPVVLPGAQCTATNDRGSWTLVTPGAVEVVSSMAHLRVACRREGYREAVVELRCVTARESEANRGKAIALQFALMTPAAAVVLPAAIVAATIKGVGAARRAADGVAAEPEACAYGAGSEVQVVMDRAPGLRPGP